MPQQRSQGPHVAVKKGTGGSAFPPPASINTNALPDALSEEALKAIEGEDGEVVEAADKKQLNVLARQRLRYLQDPYTIGKAVQALLAKDGKYDEALQLTRMASKSHKVMVSWNHLIDYQMRQQRLSSAIKLFNEMKKRAQLPNAQTYSIIFRGCAHSQYPKQAVFQATRIYNAMLARERVKPNTMHMNAVLNVCSRAKDIESLFNIVNTANKDTRRPDNLTYTTVLNGLRYATVQPGEQPDVKSTDGVDEVYLNKEPVAVSIRHARALWDEVIRYWRQGVIIVDEELVCAMGRVLRMGSRNDNDDILSLVQQTMGIERPDKPASPAIDTPKEAPEEAPKKAPKEAKEAETKTDTKAETKTEAEAAPTSAPVRVSPLTSAPGIASLTAPNISSRTIFARPGANTLSLILMSISATRKTSFAAYYWTTLTGPPYNVVPDSENWYRLLSALRRGHASTKTVELIAKMPTEYMNARIFQLVMATCAADNLNEHAFSNAGKILELMNKVLPVPDTKTLQLYLKTALTSSRRYRETMRTEVDNPSARDKAKFAFGRQLVSALSCLWEPLRQAGSAVQFTSAFQTPPTVLATDDGSNARATMNEKREIATLARMMVSAADMVVTEVMADEATIRDLSLSRNLLNRQVTRFYEKGEEDEPNQETGRRGRNEQRRGSMVRQRA
ncbi:hypothetical protein SBRCBS47491_006713 [Sporothrix bragantina]|uniref:Pentatricopeptide repeat protein n=1 Tax=Sporothrix bragantina TaxID=671064 RepID=A0ABP0C9C3_9PEZI